MNYADPSGHLAITTFLLSALLCGAISASANVIGQVVFDGATLQTIDWRKVAIAGASGFLSSLIPGTGVASIVASAAVSSIVENGLNSLWIGTEFSLTDVIKDAATSMLTGISIKGLTNIASKLTSKIFIKGNNYSQYQRYFRKQGYSFSRSEAHKMMKKYIFRKKASDDIIENALDFFSSFALYPC